MSARDAWREVCMTEYRITGDMMRATAFADSVEQRIRAATLREAADELEAIDFHPNARGSYSGAAKAFAVRLHRMADEGETP